MIKTKGDEPAFEPSPGETNHGDTPAFAVKDGRVTPVEVPDAWDDEGVETFRDRFGMSENETFGDPDGFNIRTFLRSGPGLLQRFALMAVVNFKFADGSDRIYLFENDLDLADFLYRLLPIVDRSVSEWSARDEAMK